MNLLICRCIHLGWPQLTNLNKNSTDKRQFLSVQNIPSNNEAYFLLQYWLDVEKQLNHQVGLSTHEPLLKFCVKFYTPDPSLIEEEYTRYLFGLEIKRDLATGQLQCNDNTAALMASYIVQGNTAACLEVDKWLFCCSSILSSIVTHLSHSIIPCQQQQTL